MKYLLITSLFLILLNGCSYKNAYTSFDMNTTQQLIESNTQSSKIESNSSVDALFTAIYLNNIYKNRMKKDTFLISLYIKERVGYYEFNLNGIKMESMEMIDNANIYFPLVKNQNSWNKNYIVKFDNHFRDINLTLSTDNSSSVTLNYFRE